MNSPQCPIEGGEGSSKSSSLPELAMVRRHLSAGVCSALLLRVALRAPRCCYAPPSSVAVAVAGLLYGTRTLRGGERCRELWHDDAGCGVHRSSRCMVI